MMATVDVVNVSRPAARWGVRAALADGADLLALAWGLPVAILVVGAPLALAVAVLLWLGRLALGAF